MSVVLVYHSVLICRKQATERVTDMSDKEDNNVGPVNEEWYVRLYADVCDALLSCRLLCHTVSVFILIIDASTKQLTFNATGKVSALTTLMSIQIKMTRPQRLNWALLPALTCEPFTVAGGGSLWPFSFCFPSHRSWPKSRIHSI
jgi:hypothetical protein